MLSSAENDLVRRDRAIPGLALVLDPDAFLAALRGAAPAADLRSAQITYVRYKPQIYCRVPDQPDLCLGELRCLRYRPERRYVAELRSAEKTRVILKAYTRRAYSRAKHSASAFQSRGILRIARALGCLDIRHLLAFEWLSGRLLTELWVEPRIACDSVTGAGAALAGLHDQHPNGLNSWTPDATAAELSVVSSEVGFICPDLVRRADELARRLAARLVGAPTTRCPVHGDFSANQVLVDRQEVAIIDLDWASYGEPADDLGNIIAQAERFALRGALSPSRVELLKEALLEGYARSTKRTLPQRIGLYTAVQLFRRARFPFRTREPDWPQRTESLLERAAAILDTLG